MLSLSDNNQADGTAAFNSTLLEIPRLLVHLSKSLFWENWLVRYIPQYFSSINQIILILNPLFGIWTCPKQMV